MAIVVREGAAVLAGARLRLQGEAGAGELDLAVGGGVELEQAEVRVLAGGEDDITGVSSL